MCGNRDRICESCGLVEMEAENQAEMSSSGVVFSDRKDVAFDELAWKLKTICTTKEVEEEYSLTTCCSKANNLGNGEDHYSESNGVIEICPEKPMVAKEDSDLLSCGYREKDDMSLDCQTPRENIFDSFAPGPDVLVCAPKKKMARELKVPFRRQLNFDDSYENVEADVVGDAAEEAYIFNFIYESVLDVIVLSQLEELPADKLAMQDNGLESPKTPTSLPLLTSVSETCPPAPMRLPAKSKSYFPGICRKLDFGQT